jgi:hypothetical protein
VFGWFRRRRLSEGARRRVLVALARSEEALLEAHVENVLDVLEAAGDELSLERVLELYLDATEPGEARAEIIARRILGRVDHDRVAPAGRKRAGRRAG